MEYRLGALGFLSFGFGLNRSTAGHEMGLRKYSKLFGKKDEILLFGESAGK